MITGTPGMSDDNELRVESGQRGMETLHTLAAVGASAAARMTRVARSARVWSRAPTAGWLCESALRSWTMR
jgi:hypothetical protein